MSAGSGGELRRGVLICFCCSRTRDSRGRMCVRRKEGRKEARSASEICPRGGPEEGGGGERRRRRELDSVARRANDCRRCIDAPKVAATRERSKNGNGIEESSLPPFQSLEI